MTLTLNLPPELEQYLAQEIKQQWLQLLVSSGSRIIIP